MMSSLQHMRQMVVQLMVMRFPSHADAVDDLLEECTREDLEAVLEMIAVAPNARAVRRALLERLVGEAGLGDEE